MKIQWPWKRKTMAVSLLSFYSDDVKFEDRKDCPNCHRLLGMKIINVWPLSPKNEGLRFQWECESCHVRQFDQAPYASSEIREDKWKVCDLCRQKFLYLKEYCGAHICMACVMKMRERDQDAD